MSYHLSIELKVFPAQWITFYLIHFETYIHLYYGSAQIQKAQYIKIVFRFMTRNGPPNIIYLGKMFENHLPPRKKRNTKI